MSAAALRWLTGCLLLLLSSPMVLAAKPLSLDAAAAARGDAPAEGHLEAFYDPAGDLSLEQVVAEHADRFQPVPYYFGGGFVPGAWWVRFVVDADADFTDGWWLRMHAPYVEMLDLWMMHDGAVLQQEVLGRLRPVALRDLRAPGSFAVPMERLPAGPSTVWMRLAGERSLTLEVSIVQPALLADSLVRRNTMRTIAVVLPTVLLVLATVLFFTLQDRRFFWFGVHMVGAALMAVDAGGYLGTWLLPEWPVVAARLGTVWYCLSLATASMLSLSLLEMKKGFPYLTIVVKLMLGFSLASMVVAAVGQYGRVGPYVNLALLLQSVLAAWVALVRVYRGIPLAWWQLLGFGSGAAAMLIPIAVVLRVLPYHELYMAIMSFAAPMHWLFLLTGMGVELRRTQHAAVRAQAQALEESRQFSAQLETRVSERTRELSVEVQERHRAELELQQALREQRHFLSMVSHEFRNPLSIIDVSAQSLSGALRSGQAPSQQAADRIGRATRRMVELADTLLADEWLDSSSMQLRSRNFGLGEMLHEMCAKHAEVSRRVIRCESTDAFPDFHGDPVLLQIVFRNLIENAVKYSPADKSIEASLRRDADAAVVTVRDRGDGIPREDLELVFDRYYRAPAVTAQPGLGLGLYMVRRIVELHGGSIVAGNARGGGAELTVRLPMRTAN